MQSRQCRERPKFNCGERRACLLCCGTVCVVHAAARAGRPVRVYEVDVDGQSAPAVQDAMREALVRATGRRESADDPALASVIADAPKYVKSYAAGAPRRVTSDIRCRCCCAGGDCCRSECLEPNVSVHAGCSLSAAAQRTAQDAVRSEVENVAADLRGLPITLVPCHGR